MFFSIRHLKIQTINKTDTFKQIKNETKANWNKSKSTNFYVLKNEKDKPQRGRSYLMHI